MRESIDNINWYLLSGLYSILYNKPLLLSHSLFHSLFLLMNKTIYLGIFGSPFLSYFIISHYLYLLCNLYLSNTPLQM